MGFPKYCTGKLIRLKESKEAKEGNSIVLKYLHNIEEVCVNKKDPLVLKIFSRLVIC
jgi:hypothetical protein